MFSNVSLGDVQLTRTNMDLIVELGGGDVTLANWFAGAGDADVIFIENVPLDAERIAMIGAGLTVAADAVT